MPKSQANIALFGDVSGHLKPFLAGLESVGVDIESAVIPPGRTIIQVGDLVHKGPDSDEIVSVVDRLMTTNPGQWIQLAGNHEGHHIGGPKIQNVCTCSDHTAQTLRRWRREHRMEAAAAIETPTGKTALVTHAGLTKSTWKSVGEPATAERTARRLNDRFYRMPVSSMVAGVMLAGGQEPPSSRPSVLWAHSVVEVYASWMDGEVPPFSQIHGHTSPYFFNARKWQPNIPTELLEFLEEHGKVDAKRRTTAVDIEGRIFRGIDPGFTSSRSAATLLPLEVTGIVSGITLDLRPQLMPDV